MKESKFYKCTIILMAILVALNCFAPYTFAVSPRNTADLTGDGARVTKVEIDRYITGTAPWDSDDAAGNDSSSDNMIIRTFDTVSYTFTVAMDSYDFASYEEARIKLEFVLPFSKEQATFDVAAMAWMDQTDGYSPNISTETRQIGGKSVSCQVLTCYKHLVPSEGHISVIPGEFSENLSITIGNMKNGEQFAPIISACPEFGEWNGACSVHGVSEKATITAAPVTVSAAPKYNIKITGKSEFRHEFDFNTGNTTGENIAANYGKGTVLGRVSHVNVILQLYNDNASKKMMGIELPDGNPITFDIKLSSQYTTEATNQKRDITDNYMPLLYSCDELMSNLNKADGRTIPQRVTTYFYAPQNRGTGTTSCYNGGSWHATQQGDTISVTVKDYEINMDQLPTQDHITSGINYGIDKGIGCFSTGDFWIVQPFNKVGSTNNDEYNFDIVKDYGVGSFTTSYESQSLKVTSVGGTVLEDTAGTNDAQKATNDDRYSSSLPLSLDGNAANVVFYSKIDNKKISDRGVDGTYDQYRNGLDSAFIGSKLIMCGGFTYVPQNEEQNRVYYATNLLKFYAEPFDMTGEKFKRYDTSATGFEYNYLYATKPDGTDWADDEELTHTYEDDLVFYSSLDQIPAGHKCIGVLFVFNGPTTTNTNPIGHILGIGVQVKDQNSLVNKAYAMASTTRVWSKKHFEDAQMQLSNIPAWTDSTTSLSDFPADHYKSANIDNQTFYRRETYAADGSGALGTHNSDHARVGDTLLIIGYNTSISNSLLQVSNGTEPKSVYNLDANQRVVDLVLNPNVTSDTASNAYHNKQTSVTVVETLPKYLNYIEGSSYLGGTYNQTAEAGGEQGTITGGTAFEPTVKVNPDGTTTLTWKIENAVVDQQIPPIHYSIYIGSSTDASNDVPIGTTNLSIKAYITAAGDYRAPSLLNGKLSEVGIKTTKGAAFSFGKFAESEVVDAQGTAKYVVYFNNNSSTPVTDILLLDTMPFSGVSDSNFSGDYTVDTLKLDVEKCDKSDLKIYYTTDEAYKNTLAADITKTEIQENWSEATFDAEGVVAQLSGKRPIAWVVMGELDGNSSIYLELLLDLAPETTSSHTNVYNNRLSYNSSVVHAEVTTEVVVAPQPLPQPQPQPNPSVPQNPTLEPSLPDSSTVQPSTPKQPEDSTSKQSETENTPNQPESEKIPQTGEPMALPIAVMLFVISAAGLVFTAKKNA